MFTANIGQLTLFIICFPTGEVIRDKGTGQIYHPNIWLLVGYWQYCPLSLSVFCLLLGFTFSLIFSTQLSSALWGMVKKFEMAVTCGMVAVFDVFSLGVEMPIGASK